MNGDVNIYRSCRSREWYEVESEARIPNELEKYVEPFASPVGIALLGRRAEGIILLVLSGYSGESPVFDSHVLPRELEAIANDFLEKNA